MESLLFSFLSLRRAQGTELDFVPLFLKTEKLPMGGWRAVGSHARGQSRGPPYPWQGRGEGGPTQPAQLGKEVRLLLRAITREVGGPPA